MNETDLLAGYIAAINEDANQEGYCFLHIRKTQGSDPKRLIGYIPSERTCGHLHSVGQVLWKGLIDCF